MKGWGNLPFQSRGQRGPKGLADAFKFWYVKRLRKYAGFVFNWLYKRGTFSVQNGI